MEYYVVKSIPKPAEEWVERFSKSDVSTVYEAQGKIGLLNHRLQPLIKGSSVCGPAVTAICYAGDNLMLHAAIEICSPGDVLVVSIIGESVSGMIGELMVRALQKRGVKGVIIDAGIRDAAILREIGFPVWSKAIYSEGTTKSRGGWVNSPAICGECLINPGDLVMGNDDGVVVIRREEVESVWEKTIQRMLKEEETKQKIARGELSLDFNNLRPILEKNQVFYYDTLEEI